MPNDRYHILTFQLINYFGQTAQLIQDNKAIDVIGIFDQVSLETLEINNHQALFTVASQGLPANLHGSLLQVQDQCYQIVDVQADGIGAVTLVLAETV